MELIPRVVHSGSKILSNPETSNKYLNSHFLCLDTIICEYLIFHTPPGFIPFSRIHYHFTREHFYVVYISCYKITICLFEGGTTWIRQTRESFHCLEIEFLFLLTLSKLCNSFILAYLHFCLELSPRIVHSANKITTNPGTSRKYLNSHFPLFNTII